jgi:hypothetical protein
MIFNDEGHNGKRLRKTFAVGKRFQGTGAGQEPGEPTTKYTFVLYNLSESYAKYLDGQNLQSIAGEPDNPFIPAEGIIVESNIEGGYGVFGAESYTTYVDTL